MLPETATPSTDQLDGVQVGTTPLATLAVACGTHTVRVEAPGFLALVQEASVATGMGTTLVADLQKLPTGTVVVEVTPLDARILFDGVDRGAGPNTFEAVPQGPHEIVGRKDGFLDAKANVSVEADGIARASLALLPRPSFAERAGLDRVRWGKVGVASALTLGAAGGGIGAALLYREAEANYATYAGLTWEDDTDGYYRSGVATPRAEAWATGIAGGLAAAGAGVLWVTLDRRPALQPFVGAGVGGVQGSF